MASNAIPRIGGYQRNLPAPPSVESGRFNALDPLMDLGEAFQRINEGAEKMETARMIIETREAAQGAYNIEKATKVDPDEFYSSATEKVQTVFDEAPEKARTPQQRANVQAGLQVEKQKLRDNMLIDLHSKRKDKSNADFITNTDKLINASVGADERTRAMRDAEFNALLDIRVNTGYMNLEERAKASLKFKGDVEEKTADVMIRDNAPLFLANQDGFKFLSLDTKMKLADKARKRIEDNERASDKLTDKFKKTIDAEWSADANFGNLNPAKLDQALRGDHPYISPDRARTLKAINDNPPTGNGNQAAMTTWSQYLSSGRDLNRIAKTRAELNRIQADIGAPNKYIMDRLNELQSDQTTLENQGISREANAIQRQNREISNLQNTYEADKQTVPPFIERLMGNRTQQDKAKIKAEYQRFGKEAAEKLSKTLSGGAKAKADSIPQKMKNVMEYGADQ
jgi:hypothetical protein